MLLHCTHTTSASELMIALTPVWFLFKNPCLDWLMFDHWKAEKLSRGGAHLESDRDQRFKRTDSKINYTCRSNLAIIPCSVLQRPLSLWLKLPGSHFSHQLLLNLSTIISSFRTAAIYVLKSTQYPKSLVSKCNSEERHKKMFSTAWTQSASSQ